MSKPIRDTPELPLPLDCLLASRHRVMSPFIPVSTLPSYPDGEENRLRRPGTTPRQLPSSKSFTGDVNTKPLSAGLTGICVMGKPYPMNPPGLSATNFAATLVAD